MDEKGPYDCQCHGFLGPCRDYLTETRASLDTLGIRDRYLDEITPYRLVEINA